MDIVERFFILLQKRVKRFVCTPAIIPPIPLAQVFTVGTRYLGKLHNRD